MNQFAGVLFQVYSFDTNGIRLTVITGYFKKAVLAKREFILGDLVSFGQIRIEIVLPGKAGESINGAIHGQAGSNGILNGLPIQNRQGPGLAGADRTDTAVGWGVIADLTITEKL
jgi:hypothetical protein